MGRVGVIASILVLATALAGCVGGGPGVAAAADDLPTGTLAHSSGDGVIEGTVQDDEQRPIERASVAGTHRDASNVSFEVTTDADGKFRVTGLLPGPYVLQVARIGYTAASPRIVEVPAGDVAQVQFLLTPLPVHESFVATKIYSIYWEEELGLVLPAVGYFGIITGWNSQNVTMPIEVDEEASGELAAFIAEMTWRPPVAQCGGAFRSDVYSSEQTGLDPTFPPINSRFWGDDNPHHWDNVPERARSPTHLFIPRNGDNLSAMHSVARTDLNEGQPIQTSGQWIVEINSAAEYAKGAFGTPVDLACTLDTTVTIYASTFFLETPAADWSFLQES